MVFLVAENNIGISCFRNSITIHKVENSKARVSEIGNATHNPVMPNSFGRNMSRGSKEIT
jgi:hypothetical protein